MKKRVLIIGSTGSIGVQALNVIKNNQEKFELVGITCDSNIHLISSQIKQFNPKYVGITNMAAFNAFNKEFGFNLNSLGNKEKAELFLGDEVCNVTTFPDVDIVLVACVGLAGLKYVVSAIKADKIIACANKETFVAAGELINELLKKHKAKIIPVDSEHSAIFQCIKNERKFVKRVIITASGGAFLNYTTEQLKSVTLEMALKHPNWSMGKKITIDSSTLMNKGLEVIEAKWLFDLKLEQIEAIVHPQSIIHSMVEFKDNSVLAQMSYPTMEVPISYALNYPNRVATVVKPLNFTEISKITFESIDNSKFPCYSLCLDAIARGKGFPAAINGANEIIVEKFLNNHILWHQIPIYLEKVVNCVDAEKLSSFEDVYEVDKLARIRANELIK